MISDENWQEYRILSNAMKILYYDDERLVGMETGLLESLVDLVREVWDKSATTESYLTARRKFFSQNQLMKDFGYPLVLLVDDKDKVVGQCNSIPCKVWANQKESVMYWNAGLHLLEECRGKGLGLVLPEELARRLPVVSGFFVVPQQLRTHQKLGFHIIGKIPDYVKVYQTHRFLERLDFDSINQVPMFFRHALRKENVLFRRVVLGVVAKLMSFMQWAKRCRLHSPDNTIAFSIVDRFDARIDDLWDKVKLSLKFAQVRSSASMNWQFKASDGWVKIIMEEDGELVGFSLVALRQNGENEKLAGLRLISTIDLVWNFDKPYILKQYFNFLDELATLNGADVAFCSINKQDAVKWLKSYGYIKVPPSVYFVVKSQVDDVVISDSMADWFVTRGDADAAGSLEPNTTCEI